MDDLPSSDYNVPLYTSSDSLSARYTKSTASEGEEDGSRTGWRHDTPITQDYGSDDNDTPPTKQRRCNPNSETEGFAKELEKDADVLTQEDKVTLKQLDELKEGRDSLAQMGGALEFNSDTLQRVDGVLKQLGYVPKAKRGGRKRKAQAALDTDSLQEHDGDERALSTFTDRYDHFDAFEKFTTSNDGDRNSTFTPNVKLTGCNESYETLPADKIQTLAEMSVQLDKLAEHLASHFDRSPKPYAQRKAAKLRMARSAIAVSIGKLRADKRKKQVEPTKSATGYGNVAEQLYEQARKGETSAVAANEGMFPENERAAQEDTPQEPVMSGAVHDTHEQPADADATLAAHLMEYMTSSQYEAVTALFALESSDKAKKPALEAQDLFLSTRLVCATVQLLLVDENDVTSLGQFVIDLCGEAVWQERLRYCLEPPMPEREDLYMARDVLEDARSIIAAFDGEAAGRLRDLIDATEWSQLAVE